MVDIHTQHNTFLRADTKKNKHKTVLFKKGGDEKAPPPVLQCTYIDRYSVLHVLVHSVAHTHTHTHEVVLLQTSGGFKQEQR